MWVTSTELFSREGKTASWKIRFVELLPSIREVDVRAHSQLKLTYFGCFPSVKPEHRWTLSHRKELMKSDGHLRRLEFEPKMEFEVELEGSTQIIESLRRCFLVLSPQANASMNISPSTSRWPMLILTSWSHSLDRFDCSFYSNFTLFGFWISSKKLINRMLFLWLKSADFCWVFRTFFHLPINLKSSFRIINSIIKPFVVLR